MSRPPLGSRNRLRYADRPCDGQFWAYGLRAVGSPFADFCWRHRRRTFARALRPRNAALRRAGSPLRCTKGHPAPYIPMRACLQGHVYRIDSRNLCIGVYNGTGVFIGIREKFGSHYLFGEHHWDEGPPFGTVSPQEDLGPLPAGVTLADEAQLFTYLDGRFYGGRRALENAAARTADQDDA